MANSSSSTLPIHAAQAALVLELAQVARLQAERAANPILAGALQRVATWQGRRLRMTYDDLAARERYAGAIQFFQADLYGSTDFAQRDADLARVVPVMVRMLPERVIATIATAVELHVLSQSLDRSLLARLPRADGQFSVAEYSRAYRKMGKRSERERQIRLIGEIGGALDIYVRKPLLRTALRMMRQPARFAGLAALHDFLERGFVAFQRMGGAREFLATVDTRERALMEALFAGETAPFPDPLQPRPPAAAPLAQAPG
jgi:hypothetical protein